MLTFVAWLARQGLREVYRRANREGQRAVIERLRNQYQAYRARQDALRDYDQRDSAWNKRQRTDPQSTADTSGSDPPSDTMVQDGSANIDQWKFFRDTCSVPVKRRSLIMPRISYSTWRWQSLTNFATTPCAHTLSQVYMSGSSYTDLPMYAFDLSSFPRGNLTLPTGATQLDVTHVPFYRMRVNKSVAAVDDATYTWIPVQGIRNDPSGSMTEYPSSLEKISIPNASVSYSPFINRYCHHSSDIRMIMNGSNSVPSRVHVKIVRFKDDDYAPRRYYQIGGGGPLVIWDDAITDGEKNREIGGFWDSFWAKRESNPIRSTKNEVKTPLYDVIYHRSFEFPPSSSTDQDTNPDQKVFRLFFKDGHVHDTGSGIIDALQDNVVWKDGAAGFGYKVDIPATAGVANETSIYPKSRYLYYLLIYADCFAKFTNEPQTANSPSFDLMVRGNFSNPISSG